MDGGGLFAALTFVLFGAVVVGPLLHRVDAAVAIYAALSLTVVRILPVGVALLGSHARLPTVGFIGWFGPRGLASIVFVVIAAGEPALSGASQISVIASATVLSSVFLHGLTATPLAARYAKWYEAHPQEANLMESAGAHRHRFKVGAHKAQLTEVKHSKQTSRCSWLRLSVDGAGAAPDVKRLRSPPRGVAVFVEVH